MAEKTRVILEREFPGGIRYGEEELEAVTRVLRNQSPFRYYGPKCGFEAKNFELEFARYLASSPGQEWPMATPFLVTAVNSGTGALEVALDALGVGCGDEVLVPGFMWISTLSSVVRNRAIPVLVDCDDTMNISAQALLKQVSDRTAVVIVVHMAGEPASMGPVMEAVRMVNRERRQRGARCLKVLEDCAQAIGGQCAGIPGSQEPLGEPGTHRVGVFGDVAIYSLQLNKNITSGEGGILATRDPALHDRIRAIHDVGFLRDSKGTGNVEELADQLLLWGQGRRFTELQGALGRVQLRKLDDILRSMRWAHARLEAHARSLPKWSVRAHADETGGHSGGFLLIHLDAEGSTEAQLMASGRSVAAELRDRGLLAFYVHDYEVHVYYNIKQLDGKQPISSSGCPWNCVHNKESSGTTYGRGTLPRLDSWFLRTVGVVIPGLMTEEQLLAVQQILTEVNREFCGGAGPTVP